MADTPPPRPTVRSLWGPLALLYVASGAPLGLATKGIPAVYKDAGLSLASIGLLALVELPWTFKFVWAPLLDRFGDRRHWAAATQAVLAASLLALSFFPADSVPPAAWAALIVLAAASATQDVAVDGYAVAAVPAEFVGPANGLRVTAYRVGLVLGGGFLAGRAATLGWATTWRIAAGAFAAFALLTPRLPAAPQVRRPEGPPWSPWAELVRRPGFFAFAALVFLFKVGDYAMARMTTPCLQDRGFSLAEVSDWVTPMEIVATILGAWVGGWVTKRVGLFTALWTLGLFQAVSNLGYAAAADAGKGWLWAAAAFEPFCNGLGTAPFLSLLMVSCRKEHAGAQFALLTALMALSRTAVGAVSGYGAERWGYSTYFAATFLLALPAFFLLPAARRWLVNLGASRPTAARSARRTPA